MKILVTDTVTLMRNFDVSLDVLKKFGDVEIHEKLTREELFECIKDADVLLCNEVIVNREVFEKAKKLKLISVLATGYNTIDIEAAREFGVTVCNAGSYSTDAVAQQVFGYILNYYSQTAAYGAIVKDGAWESGNRADVFTFPTDEIAGKTIGIVGYGNIGRRVADIALAFGMNVLACNRSKKIDERVTFVDFDELLQKSDIVSLHCPQHRENKGMFNKETFEKMKDGAFFINTARGGLVVEEDLRDALNSGKLCFAATDVLRREPMRSDCPLKQAKNILITPHTGWAPKSTRERLIKIMADNIEAYLNGKPINVVS